MHSPSRRFLALTRWAFALTLVVVALAAASFANARMVGRITRIVPEKRLVVMQRSNGTTFRAVLEKGAKIQRMGVGSTMGQFRVGDYAVIQVAGALNEDPLVADGLFDVHTAGKAPPPVGSVDTSIQGGYAIPGGAAAKQPHEHHTHDVPGIGMSSQNIPAPNYTPVWNPTMPWPGVPTEAGQPMPAPALPRPEMQPTYAPGVPQHTDPGVGAYGPTRTTVTPTNFPPPPQGGTMTAAPSPSGNPWLGQAVGHNNNPQSPPVTTTRTMPSVPTVPSSPVASLELVSLQGNVTQVATAQRALVMQAMVGGRVVTVQVRVPAQVEILTSRSQSVVGLENIRIGDYILLNGIQLASGAVEARKIYVNQ